jgi:hypothetical protein
MVFPASGNDTDLCIEFLSDVPGLHHFLKEGISGCFTVDNTDFQ